MEEAWDAWKAAQAALDVAEQAVAASIERLMIEKLTLTEVCDLTGLDQATLRRLRQLKPTADQPAEDSSS